MKNFDEFARNYKLLKPPLLGRTATERIPRESSPFSLCAAVTQLKITAGVKLNYFDLRHSLTPERKKVADLRVITHFEKKLDPDAENARGITYWRYKLLKLRYLPELRYINSILFSKESPSHPEQKLADNYILRWGYMLDVEPSFVELIHGTSKQNAFYALETIV